MIEIISQENAHQYGDVMPSMYRLRYRAFVQRQSYNVYSIRKMEYDSYDTPATVYAVWRDADGLVRGCTRMAPTDRPYMIKDLWPYLVNESELPSDSTIWEASRFCIDKELAPDLRRRIHLELLAAMLEFGLQNDIRYMIGVMQPRIWRRVFIDVGWPIKFLGTAHALPGESSIAAGHMPITAEILQGIRDRHLLPEKIISNSINTHFHEVA